MGDHVREGARIWAHGGRSSVRVGGLLVLRGEGGAWETAPKAAPGEKVGMAAGGRGVLWMPLPLTSLQPISTIRPPLPTEVNEEGRRRLIWEDF